MEIIGYAAAILAAVLFAVLLWRLNASGRRNAHCDDDHAQDSTRYIARPIDLDHHDGHHDGLS